MTRSRHLYLVIRTAFAASALIAMATLASGATITVNIGADPIDIDWQTATIADLPGPDGNISLSEAFIASDNTPGHDTIEFAIPPSEWQLQWLFPGQPVIYSSYTYFWRSSDELTIDGTTQTAFTGDTNPDGAELRIYGGEIYINGNNSTLMGIDGGAVTLSGSNGIATGNTGDINLTFYGGSGSLIQGNIVGTLKLDRTSHNVVVGNTLRRIRNLGWFGGGQPNTSNRIGGPNAEDRNHITGYGTVNSEGLPAGHAIQMADAIDTIIENNYIGTTPDGLDFGSTVCTMGIRFEGENHGTIVRNNLIAALGIGQGPHHAGQLFGWAIYVMGAGDGLEIVGNTVGLDANGQPTLGSVTGIEIGVSGASTMTGIRIGGAAPGEGNVVAGHYYNGVFVGRNMGGVRIRGNSVYQNASLGIDLVTSGYAYGLTPNDPLDADTGANGLQNFPVLTSASSGGSGARITGSLHSSPSSTFTLDFYASPECDANGHGEGQVYLGATDIATNAAGDAPFDIVLPITVTEGWVVTATATLEPTGDTSEFSECAVVGTGVADAPQTPPVDTRTTLSPAAPNPFRDQSTLQYELPAPGPVHLAVYDAAGRSVRVLEDGLRAAGSHRTVWDGRNEAGQRVATGVYFYRLRAGNESLTRQVLLTK